jgi:alkanesulfonate monooxygenase SsuD/methylene tetrahydromethanopterin reductase-like flavin-dependent oxidoreductase (luciferase family)
MQQFEMMQSPEGSLVLGTPDEVATKIMRWREVLGIDRFMLHVSVGTMDHDHVMRSIRSLGADVRAIIDEADAASSGDGS